MSTASETKYRSLKLKYSHDEVEKLHQFLRDAIFDILGDQTDKELGSSIILAVHEAFTNVVRHACIEETKEKIQLLCKSEKKGIAIELIDHGIEFNPLESPKVFDTNLIDDLQEIEDLSELEESKFIGGHGISIIQAAATSTRYRRSKSGANHLYLYFEMY